MSAVFLLLAILAFVQCHAYVYPLPRAMGVQRIVGGVVQSTDNMLLATSTYRQNGALLQTAEYDNGGRRTGMDCSRLLNRILYEEGIREYSCPSEDDGGCGSRHG